MASLLAAATLWLIQSTVAFNPVHAVNDPTGPTHESASTLDLELRRKLHPLLARQLLASNDDRLRVIVVMRDQPALDRLTSLDRVSMVGALQAQADQAQAGVRSILDRAQTNGQADEVRSLWLNNSIAARLDRATLFEIAARQDVALIELDQYRQWIEPMSHEPSAMSNRPSVEWNIAQIRADQVWSALNITGTGAVVASMDTGVDWLHPALQTSYRGYNSKGPPSHWGNWFDATEFPSQYPYDGNGHGTHTMGTLAGSDGIGVAPGAKWIATRVLDSNGFGLDSWIHAGFQWILAPGGDPNRAPDVLNNSWGSALGAVPEFRNDVRLLNAAGIIAVFSNGNNGPQPGTVGAPASYPEAFGVGATDRYDVLANFSSHGPSPFGVMKPDLSAPGVQVRSSFAGGIYVIGNGTSMAAPHVAGVAALMRSVSPTISITATRYALTSTAIHPTTDTYPNNAYGWGRLDAYRAVLAVAQTGMISGVITRNDNGLPIANATLHAESMAGTNVNATTNVNGNYQSAAAASIYTLTASAFGYQPQTFINVIVVTNTVTRRDFGLTPLPTGVVEGRITDLTGTASLDTSLSVQNSPIKINASGAYTLQLPIGTHILEARSPRHRVVTATITIEAGKKTTQDFALPDAPSILLVDSGQWYNQSEITYYQQALDDLGYLYADWPIRDANSDQPTTPTLRAYDVVIWSSPFDSPGYIGAGNVISDYLAHGGRLLLSGQDVGFFDYLNGYASYVSDQLFARVVDDDGPTRILTGSHTFAGQVISITGEGGANNQMYPDAIESIAPLLTEDAFDYAPDQSGGQTIGLCQPYRATYLSFGFEAINDRAARDAVMSRAFDFFARPRTTHYYVFEHTSNPLIGPASTSVTDTILLHNFDEVAPKTSFSIDINSAWGATITPTQVTLPACKQQTFTVTINIPSNAALGTVQPITITATPTLSPALAVTTTLSAKAPGSVLLVNDDRWYPVDAPYRSALQANGIAYDVWRVPTTWAGPESGAPSFDRLRWYPEVIWFTGYDWYQTLTANNEQALRQYLTGGGRLMLSSQDYLGERGFNDFGRQVLGLLDRADDLSSTLVAGTTGGLFDGLNFAPIEFPYTNYSDALAPQPDAQVALVGQHGWPSAVTHRYGNGKTLFMALGFEGLPAEAQPEAMNRIVGYLSRLGDSTVRFDRAAASAGERVTMTIVARNDRQSAIDHAAFAATLPLSVTYAGGDALAWSGSLAPDQAVTYTIAMTVNADHPIGVPVVFDDFDQRLHFTSTARLMINAPSFAFDLAPAPNPIRLRHAITWALTARNTGSDAPATYIVAHVPFDQPAISGTVTSTIGSITQDSGTIQWNGSLASGQIVTLTYEMSAPFDLQNKLYYGSAILSDGQNVWHAGAWLSVQPYQRYLPLIRK